MAIKSYQLVLTAGVKRLSDVYGGAAGVLNAKDDIPYRQVVLYAEAAAAFIGMDVTVSTTVYGATLASAASISLGQVDAGPLKLSDFFVTGAGCTLHILGLPF